MIIGVDGNEANVTSRVGSNQYAFEVLHALHDLPDSSRHEWIIYLREKPLNDLPKENPNWHYKVFGPKRFWTQVALPFSLMIGERPDVFFTPGHYRPRWSSIPTVISIMDLGYLQFPEQFNKRDLIQLKRWTESSIKKANHILAISQSTKRDVMKYYGIDDEKITVAYLGYDKKKFEARISKAEIERVKKKYKIQNEYILFLSTLKPSKNVEGLLEAFRLLGKLVIRRPKSPMIQEPNDLSLVIAGKKGWMYEKIFDKVKDLGLTKRIIFTDFVADEDVPALMAGAEAFVLPSFWEGFGIPVLEAMAVGTPVVVSNVASLPEIVGGAGILVDPNDTKDIARGIEKALENHDSLSKKGLAQAKKFDWEKTARQTLKALEELNP